MGNKRTINDINELPQGTQGPLQLSKQRNKRCAAFGGRERNRVKIKILGERALWKGISRAHKQHSCGCVSSAHKEKAEASLMEHETLAGEEAANLLIVYLGGYNNGLIG